MKITKLPNGVQHIEAEGCIVNIQEDLHDSDGKRVTAVSIIPDNGYVGEKIWKLRGHAHNSVIQTEEIRKAV